MTGKVKFSALTKGFTFLELVVVLVILSLLAALAAPVVSHSILKSKEAVLRQNLLTTRKALDDFFADHGVYPADLDELVEKKYLRSRPYDPIVESDELWLEIETEYDDLTGIDDLKSGSELTAIDGSYYSQW